MQRQWGAGHALTVTAGQRVRAVNRVIEALKKAQDTTETERAVPKDEPVIGYLWDDLPKPVPPRRKTSNVKRGAVVERCRRKAYWSSKNGLHLTPLVPPLRFATGTMIHRAHQLWINDPDTPLITHALAACNEYTDNLKARYLERVGAPVTDAELAPVLEAVSFVWSMCENYSVRYKTPLPPEYRLISAEQKISIQVPGSEHTLEGRVDGIVQHVPTGRYDVLERKTYSARPKEALLTRNDQFRAYCWLLKQLKLCDQLPCVLYDTHRARAYGYTLQRPVA
jgi:hypothetical protein